MLDAIQNKQQEISDLCRRFHVQRLELFGSAAGDRFDPSRSDLDFLVLFESGALPGEYADRYFGLLEGLEDLFGRRVDLVELEAIRNPYFYEVIQSSRTLLYAA